MKITTRLAARLAMGLVTVVWMGSAHAKCKSVNGHITSQQVTQFSNGDPCLSPLGICTEGRFIGGLIGDFTFTAQTMEPTSDAFIVFITGDVNIDTDCGTLVLRDASAFSLDVDGQYAGLETVDGNASMGNCAGASGRIRTSGVFMSGCVACDFRGEICTP